VGDCPFSAPDMAAFLRGEAVNPFDTSERPFVLVDDVPPSDRMFARRLRLGNGGWPSDWADC
jgi:hypothetical protein